MADSSVLKMWVVYERPRDFPEHFVVRGWNIVPGEQEPQRDDRVQLFLSLATARRWVQWAQPGVVCLRRSANDDPAILEVWL